MTSLMEDLELTAAIVDACRGDEKARELVIEAHLPLVRSLAARYRGRGESVDDLAQVGAIGLVLALQRFDPSRGIPFRSFAIPTIVGEIRRHFRDRSWAMHVPRRLKELSLRLTRTIEDQTAQLGRPPTIAELAAELGIGEDDVLEAMDVASAYSTRSLSEPQFGDADDDSYRAALAQTDDGFAEVEDVAFIEQGFEALDGRLRTIVQLRFFDGRTQSEIASQLGISQMHVSRLLRQALELMHGRLVEAEDGDRR